MNFIFRYLRKKILQDMEEQINGIIDERWGSLQESLEVIQLGLSKDRLPSKNKPPWRELE